MKKISKDKIIGNIFQTLARQIVTLIISFITSVFIARTLGPNSNGKYALALLIASTFSNTFNLGINSANVYFINRDRAILRTAILSNFIIWIILSILGLILGVFLIAPNKNLVSLTLSQDLFLAAIAYFPIMLLKAYLFSILQAIQDFRSYNQVLLISPILNLVIFTTLSKIHSINELDIFTIIIGSDLITLIILIHKIFPLLKLKPPLIESNQSLKEYLITSLKYAWKIHLSNFLTLLNYRADMFLISALLGSTQVGIYAIAVQLAEKIWMFSTASSTVIFPKLSELNKNENNQKTFTPKIARTTLWVSTMLALILAFLSRPTINILYGKSFEDSALILIILLPGIVLLSFARILANDIASRNRADLNIIINLCVVTLNICLNIFLIPRFNLIGAASATSIAYLVNTLLSIFFYTSLSRDNWFLLLFPRTLN